MGRVGDQLKFDNPIPLNVLVPALLGANFTVLEQNGILHPRENKVAEVFATPVIGSNVPTHPVIRKRDRNDFSLSTTTFD